MASDPPTVFYEVRMHHVRSTIEPINSSTSHTSSVAMSTPLVKWVRLLFEDPTSPCLVRSTVAISHRFSWNLGLFLFHLFREGVSTQLPKEAIYGTAALPMADGTLPTSTRRPRVVQGTSKREVSCWARTYENLAAYWANRF